MSVITEVLPPESRALNQAFLYCQRAPLHLILRPGRYVRTLRSALRMSQSQLSRRSGIPRAHIARIEVGKIDPRLSTLHLLFNAMFCDLLLLPRARRRPHDAICDRRLERGKFRLRIWDD
jgi:transcriptional regulator with XRE-family HTH domain